VNITQVIDVYMDFLKLNLIKNSVVNFKWIFCWYFFEIFTCIFI